MKKKKTESIELEVDNLEKKTCVFSLHWLKRKYMYVTLHFREIFSIIDWQLLN